EREQRQSADTGNGARRRDVVERVPELAPRESAEREARDARVGDDPHRSGEEGIPDTAGSQPTDGRPRGRPVPATDRDERYDRDRAEVPDPRTDDRVVNGPGDECIAGGCLRHALT